MKFSEIKQNLPLDHISELKIMKKYELNRTLLMPGSTLTMISICVHRQTSAAKRKTSSGMASLRSIRESIKYDD